MPSAKAVVGVNVQLPEAFAVAVPKGVVPCKMLTVLLASAVPARVGVVSLVVLATVVKVGGMGGVVSATTAFKVNPRELEIVLAPVITPRSY